MEDIKNQDQSEAQTEEPKIVASANKPKPPAAEVQATGEPKWLPDRLERERRKILRELGADNVSDVKTALSELKDRRSQELTQLERLQARNAELESAATQRDSLAEMVENQAHGAMARLNEEQRAAVLAVAGEDPQKRLAAIAALKPTWAKNETAMVPAPVTTAPTEPAPTASSAAPVSNHLATYQNLQRSNPVMAAQYQLLHWKSIQNAKQARS